MALPPVSAEADSVVVFATSWCPYCRRLLVDLKDAGIPHRVIDVDKGNAAASFVESVNRGNRTVPTVLFPDGSTRTNPGVEVVSALLGR